MAFNEQIQHQSNWVTNAPNSMLKERDLQSLTLTSPLYFTCTPTPPTSSRFSNPISRGTSHTLTAPNMLTFVVNRPAPPTDKCQTHNQTNRLSPLTPLHRAKTTSTSQTSSLRKNLSPPSPKPHSPSSPTSSSQNRTPHHFAYLPPSKRTTKNSPQYHPALPKSSSART